MPALAEPVSKVSRAWKGSKTVAAAMWASLVKNERRIQRPRLALNCSGENIADKRRTCELRWPYFQQYSCRTCARERVSLRGLFGPAVQVKQPSSAHGRNVTMCV